MNAHVIVPKYVSHEPTRCYACLRPIRLVRHKSGRDEWKHDGRGKRKT